MSCLESKRRRHVGAIGLEQRRTAGDLDLSLTSPSCEREVDRRLRVDADVDSRHDRRLEALQLGPHLVGAGQQPVFDVEPRLVGDDRVGGLALDAGDRDGHARQDGAGCL